MWGDQKPPSMSDLHPHLRKMSDEAARRAAGGGGDEAGVALVFNPTDMPLNATVRLPLYYTGVHDVALVSIDEAPPASHSVARDFSLSLPLRMRPRSVTTVVVSDGAPRRFT